MKLVHYNDTESYDVDFTHDQFLCKSGDQIFLSHLEFDEEDGYFITDEHGVKYFMYNPQGKCPSGPCEVYLIVTDECDVMDTIDPNWADDGSDPGEGGPPYDAATRTGMYDHD